MALRIGSPVLVTGGWPKGQTGKLVGREQGVWPLVVVELKGGVQTRLTEASVEARQREDVHRG
jgi:hypothetical protein